MMGNGELEDLIRQVSDPRTWRVAAGIVDLARRAKDSDCTCDICTELRAYAGTLDDINNERP